MLKTFRSTKRACYTGYVTQAVINNLAPLLFLVFQDKFGLTLSQISTLILVNFVSQLVIDVVATKYTDRIGYRAAVLIGHGSAVLGLVFLSWLPLVSPNPFLGLIFAMVLYSIGGGFIEVIISPIVDAIPSPSKASGMSLLHSFYCWGQAAVVVIATVFIRLFGADFWYLLPLIFAAIPLANMLVFSKVPLPKTVSENERTPVRKLFASPLFLLGFVVMACAGAAELIMSQWASLFAERGLGVSKFAGDLLGPCLFAVFMAIGRMAYGFFGKRLPLKTLLVGSGILCIGCYLVTSLVPNAIVSLCGCALTGLAVSLMWPGMFSVNGEAFPGGGTTTFGLLAIAGDLGCTIGPVLVGYVGDAVTANADLTAWGAGFGLDATQLGLRAGILIGTVFPLILLVCMIVYCRLTSARKKEASAA